ncbi:MAG TPA: tyrosine--tRNA ligase [Patescibacteria group bacterium]
MSQTDTLLARGVDKIYPSKEELERLLNTSKKLRVYQGFDPTSPQLHIGHLIGLRKLRQWQDLGHEVIFLIGDFTGRIGDPTGKEETRQLLSKERVDENAKAYKKQAGKVLRFNGNNPVKIKFNSQWLEKMSVQDVFDLAAQVTYQQIIERDLYQRRIQQNKDLSINEVMYPLMQGYDSVAMDVDVEVGGKDQLFNMMMGRHLMHKIKHKNKFVMTTQLLTDSAGNKIGKTAGNAVALTDSPSTIFGAIMSFPDETIIKGFECLTDVEENEIKIFKEAISDGKNPLSFKKRLAFEVVKQLNNEQSAQNAQREFERVFSKKEKPQEINSISISKPNWKITDFLTENDLAGSKSEAKRLIEQGAIEIDGQTYLNQTIEFKNGQIVKIGKKRFVKINLN